MCLQIDKKKSALNIAEFSVNNRVLVNILMLLMIVGGIIGYLLMTREVFPVVSLDRVAISTSFPGVSPEEIEKNITIPIENAIKGVAGIEHIDSISLEGVSMIEAELEQGRDIKMVAQDIRSKIERITDLPEEAEEPLVVEIESEIPVIMVNISGSVPEETIRRVADDLEDRIGLIEGVASVAMSGYREREVLVELDPDRMYAFGIGINEVVMAIHKRNVDLSGGILKGAKEELLLRTAGQFGTVEDVRNTVIRGEPEGRHIYLKDIGRALFTYEEERNLSRVNGERAITLTVTKKLKGDSIDIVEAVTEMVSDLRNAIPNGTHITLTQNSAMWIKSRLQTLYINGAIGFFLVCITLFLVLNWRMALWTAIGIPTSFLGAFIMMNFLGHSVNMLSLFAMIVVLGLVVDDAIVVTENVYRHMQAGYSPKEAAVMGTKQVLLPVIATVSTTIAAFIPMLMMTGIMGKFIRVIPLVVSLVLLTSLVEALFILPSHLADFSKNHRHLPHHREGDNRWFMQLRNGYQAILLFCLRRRYGVVLAIIATVAALVAIAYYQQKFVLFSVKDIPGFVVMVEAPAGTKLEETSRIISDIEQKAATLPSTDVNAVVAMVGGQLDFQTGRPKSGSNLGQVFVELADFDAPERRNGYEVLREMREKIRGVTGLESLKIDEIQGGPPLGAALELKIRGNDLNKLQALARETVDFLQTIPGVKDIRDDYSPGKKELQLTVDPAKAAIYGLDVATVARAIRASFHGETASRTRRDGDTIDVVVRLAEPYRNDYRYLEQLNVRNGGGVLVPIKSVVDTRLFEGANAINRKDHRRAITISADVDTNTVTSRTAARLVKEHFSDLTTRHPGYDLIFGGETEEQRKSVASLFRAYIIALLVIYAILGGVFKSFIQPFVVMFTLPFGIIGVIIGHYVMGQEISLLSLIGLVALSGVVVNDSLLLVDFINRSRDRGAGRWRSIVMSARIRMRPIMLTTLTTILGLITLSFQTKGQAGYLAPMAISLVWGLAFATGLTLLVIPSLFAIADDLVVLGKRPPRC